MKVEMNLIGLEGVLKTLESLPPEVVSKRGGPVKLALRKGAQVILKAEQQNLRAVMGHEENGQRREATGLLLKSLIASRGKPPTGVKGERYLVRPKSRVKYPRSGGKAVTVAQTARWLEYGTTKQPAEPFIRPAVQAKGGEAIRTIETDLVRRVDLVVKKLAAANKGR